MSLALVAAFAIQFVIAGVLMCIPDIDGKLDKPIIALVVSAVTTLITGIAVGFLTLPLH